MAQMTMLGSSANSARGCTPHPGRVHIITGDNGLCDISANYRNILMWQEQSVKQESPKISVKPLKHT